MPEPDLAGHAAIGHVFTDEHLRISLINTVLGMAVDWRRRRPILGNVMGWNTEISVFTVIVAVGFSAAVGVFFGFYPARKAAALNPIDALRYE